MKSFAHGQIKISDDEYASILETTPSFSIYDPVRSVREHGVFKNKWVRDRFLRFVDEISYHKDVINDDVKRTAIKILREYIVYLKENKMKFVVKDDDVFIRTLIYYARILNHIPTQQPKIIDKKLKRFISEKYGEAYKKNMIELKNSTYPSLVRELGFSAYYVDNELYKISRVIDSYVPKEITLRKRSVVVASILYHAIMTNDYDEELTNICNVLNVTPYYLKSYYSKNRDVIVKSYNKMQEEDKKELFSAMSEMIKKLSTAI